MYCTCCGLCCRGLDKIELPEEYKTLDDGSGTCIYLKENMCSIYDNRPALCNSEKMFELYYHQIFLSMDKFEEYLKEKCKLIQERHANEGFGKDNKCE